MPMGCPLIGGVFYIRNNSINGKYQQLLVTHFLPKAKSPPQEKDRVEAVLWHRPAELNSGRMSLKHNQQSLELWCLTSGTLGKSLGLCSSHLQRKLIAACACSKDEMGADMYVRHTVLLECLLPSLLLNNATCSGKLVFSTRALKPHPVYTGEHICC